MDQKIEVIVPEGAKELKLTVLEGKAPKQPEPQPLKVEGKITAPAEFYTKRKDIKFKDRSYFDPTQTRVEVERLEGRITLFFDETSCYNSFVSGSLSISETYKALELGEWIDEKGILLFIHTNRLLFEEPVLHLEKLEEWIESKATKAIKGISANIEFFEGDDPQEITFDFLRNGDFFCVSSLDIDSAAQDRLNKIIDSELSKFGDELPILEV